MTITMNKQTLNMQQENWLFIRRNSKLEKFDSLIFLGNLS